MNRKGRWLLCGAYVGLWTTMLLLPARTIQDLSQDLIEPTWKYVIAKSLHVTSYVIMTSLLGWVHIPARYRWLAAFFLVAHAASTEILQQLVPGRTGEVNDVGIDMIGIVLGFLLTWKWWTHPD